MWKCIVVGLTLLSSLWAWSSPTRAATPTTAWGFGAPSNSMYSVNLSTGACTLVAQGGQETYVGWQYRHSEGKIYALDAYGRLWRFSPTASSYFCPELLSNIDLVATYNLNRVVGLAECGSYVHWYCLGVDNTTTYLFHIDIFNNQIYKVGTVSANTYYTTLGGAYSLGGFPNVNAPVTNNTLGYGWSIDKTTGARTQISTSAYDWRNLTRDETSFNAWGIVSIAGVMKVALCGIPSFGAYNAVTLGEQSISVLAVD